LRKPNLNRLSGDLLVKSRKALVRGLPVVRRAKLGSGESVNRSLDRLERAILRLVRRNKSFDDDLKSLQSSVDCLFHIFHGSKVRP
jgi:hypothetical protein